MATLILTAVGTAVGGPIGGAIGAILGQQVDNRLFAPKARQGPRLGDLAVQTSTYGTTIPKIFGTMRVAGCVIWATDLREERSTGGGGKGQPSTVNYSYSANFAVVLSGRRIRAVKRIWADGKLLRGAAGDFKSATGYRLYLGDEEQPVDPLIASAEGVGNAPAYRGLAYAVFEDFQLADYGNRIPSLSFEVEAEAAPVAIGFIAEELSGSVVIAGESVALTGYAAGRDSIRAAIEALGDVVPLSLVEGQEKLLLTSRPGGTPAQIGRAEAGATADGAGGRTEIQRQATCAIPGEVSLAYHEVERDYQTGLQRAVRGAPAHRSDRRALPAVLSAEQAKGLAEHRLAALWAARTSGKWHLGWRRSDVRPGTILRIEGEPGLWKVGRWTFERGVVTLAAARLAAEHAPAPPANPGRPVDQPDRLHGPTTALLLDLPLGSESLPTRAPLLVAAAGREEGWRRAELMTSFDGGASWHAAGSTAGPAVIGTVLTTLPPGGSALRDERNMIDVQLLNDAMWLEGRSDVALSAGANLALVGEELVQFSEAEALGDRRFRLRRLLRGRRGTEWAAAEHGAGEPFALIQPETLKVVEAPEGAAGGEARLLALGVGDGSEGAMVIGTVTGEALRPPSPVRLRAKVVAGGAIEISWVRRSRNGWAWQDGSDTPLSEESETYRLTLSGPGFRRALMLSQPRHLYTADEQAGDGFGGVLAIEVVQLGTVAASRAARLTLNW